MEQHICKNCGNKFNGKFCNNCGQKADVKRINFQYILHDLSHSVFHIESGFLYTFKQLALKPGITIREYLLGKRISLFKPVSYAFVISVLCTILFNTLHLHTFATGYTIEDFEKAFGLMGHYYFGIILVFHIPYISLLSWLAMRDAHFNYAEHLILNTYITGQQVAYRVLIIPVLILFNNSLSIMDIYRVFVAIILFYQVWAYYTLFQTQNKPFLIIRAILVVAVGWGTFQVMFSWVVKTLLMRSNG